MEALKEPSAAEEFQLSAEEEQIPAPETEIQAEESTFETPETAEAPVVRRRKGIRPELVMGIIAVLATILLGVMIVLCMPHFTMNEDPEALPEHNAENYITGVILEVNPEEDPEAVPETE